MKTNVLNPFNLLTRALTVYKKRFVTLFLVCALPIAAQILLTYLLTLFLPLSLMPFLIPISLLSLVLAFWATFALMQTVKADAEGINFITAYRRAATSLGSFLLISILFLLAMVGCMALLAIPVNIAEKMALPINPIAKIGVFILMAAMPILFCVWFSLSNYVLLYDGATGLKAFFKSREYARGRFGRVLLCLVFMILFVFVVGFLPDLIMESPKFSTVLRIYNIILSLILLPFIISYMNEIFLDLRALKGEIGAVPTRKFKVIFISAFVLGLVALSADLYIYFNQANTEMANISTDANNASRDGIVAVVRAGLALNRAHDLLKNGPPGNFPAKLDEVPAGKSCSETDQCFTIVLPERGVADDNWTKVNDTTYTFNDGTTIFTYTYSPENGKFSSPTVPE